MPWVGKKESDADGFLPCVWLSIAVILVKAVGGWGLCGGVWPPWRFFFSGRVSCFPCLYRSLGIGLSRLCSIAVTFFLLSCFEYAPFFFCGETCGGLRGLKDWRGGFFAQTVLWEVCECGASNYGRPEAQRRPRTTKKHIFFNIARYILYIILYTLCT